MLDDDGRGTDASPQEQRSCPVRVTVQIPLDPELKSHGFTVSTHTPAQVEEVVAGTHSERIEPDVSGSFIRLI